MSQLFACYLQVLASIIAGLTVYTLIHSAPAWGLMSSGIGPWALAWAVKSSPATLQDWPAPPPAPSPTCLTFWSSELSRMFQGDNTDPGDLLEVGPRGPGTHLCLGRCQLPPSRGVLQTWAKQGHIIAASGNRRRAGKGGEILPGKGLGTCSQAPFK